jgi:hypothetical protein
LGHTFDPMFFAKRKTVSHIGLSQGVFFNLFVRTYLSLLEIEPRNPTVKLKEPYEVMELTRLKSLYLTYARVRAQEGK